MTSKQNFFRNVRRFAAALSVAAITLTAAAQESPAPVFIGLDAEFGLVNSTSAQSIERGIAVAIAEINSAGGVLGGRPLVLIPRDNRSVPARGIANLRDFAARQDLVAVFGGRYSPVLMEQRPVVEELGLILLAVWSSADGIIDNGMTPNWIFRLSLRDSLAMPAMLDHLAGRGIDRVGLLLANTSWGRSNLAAAERHLSGRARPSIAGTEWYNWGDQTIIDHYENLIAAGAEAVVFVANDVEGAIMVREMAQLPAAAQVPIVSHWGVTGGAFVQQAGPALQQIDFTVIQTFSFFRADPEIANRVLDGARRLFGISRFEDIESPVGMAHAYDMTHILARAIDLAGTTDRAAVRDALEQVRDYRGLIRHYDRPFAPDDHEALGPDEVILARYDARGVIRPLPGNGP